MRETGFLFVCFYFCLFFKVDVSTHLCTLYTQHEARTHDPEINSCLLLHPSQPGAPLISFINHEKENGMKGWSLEFWLPEFLVSPHLLPWAKYFYVAHFPVFYKRDLHPYGPNYLAVKTAPESPRVSGSPAYLLFLFHGHCGLAWGWGSSWEFNDPDRGCILTPSIVGGGERKEIQLLKLLLGGDIFGLY